MNNEMTAAALFSMHAEKLGLSWVAGRKGEGRPIRPSESDASSSSFVSWTGYMNLIHPCRVQVLGPVETAYLNELGPSARRNTLERLFSGEAACIIVSDGLQVSDECAAFADDYALPLLRSDFPGYEIINRLQHSLSDAFADCVYLHGVFMEVLGIGVLLTGKSGVGKSELALELISRNHRLIADDAPEFRRIAVDEVNGSCPSGLVGFLEVRGLGVLNIRAMFGDSVIKLNKNLRLIIELQRMTDQQLAALDRLQGNRRLETVLDVEVPQVTLPVVPGHNLAVLVEGAVRNHILLMKGYNAADAFTERQQRRILGEDA